MQDKTEHSSFAGKLFRQMPRPARQCPKEIGYREVVAYGELVYRSRLDLRTTMTDLATVTRCERWRTLPKVVERLRKHGLADEQLRALPDGMQYFHRKRAQKRRWQDSLQTTTVYRLRPDAELSEVQNGVLWTVHSFNSAGQRPHVRSVAKLLRLDCRTVSRHLTWLQERTYLDTDLSVVADPRHWQDAAPKAKDDPDVRWQEFAAEWVGSRYDNRYCGGKTRFALSRSHFRRSLQDGCEAMMAAGYTSVEIRDYWRQEVPEACRGDGQLVLMEYFVERAFYKLFPAVEQVTKRNRQLGKFHGDCSSGLLRKVTVATARTMKARLVEGGVEALELWSPDFSTFGTTASRPGARGAERKTAEPATGRDAASRHPCGREEFERLLRHDAPELDAGAWLERILASQRFKDDPEQLSLDCYQALSDLPSRRERNLERLLCGSNGKA